MSDENDKVTQLFGNTQRGESNEAVAIDGPRVYDIYMNDEAQTKVPYVEGYLVSNGMFMCVLERPNDVNSIIFFSPQENVKYVLETEEVKEA